MSANRVDLFERDGAPVRRRAALASHETIAGGTTGNKDCDHLLEPVLERSLVQEFSRRQLMDSVMEETAKVSRR